MVAQSTRTEVVTFGSDQGSVDAPKGEPLELDAWGISWPTAGE